MLITRIAVKSGRITKNKCGAETKVKAEVLADEMMLFDNAPVNEEGCGMDTVRDDMDCPDVDEV